MKLLVIFVIVTVSVCSCIYDPPKKGISVFIENQTNEFLYIVPDSLKANNYLICYDTAYVNGQQYITAKGNYIPPFSKYEYFLSEQHIMDLVNQKKEAQNIYIVLEKNLNMITDSIIERNLFKKVDIFYKKLSVDSTYHLFIWKDNIKFTADFDWQKMRRITE